MTNQTPDLDTAPRDRPAIEVTDEMLDAGLDVLESSLEWPYNWNETRRLIKEAYLAMERLRAQRVQHQSQPEAAASPQFP